MALPTKDNLLTLSISFLGKPFCQVEAKQLDTKELDISWLGKPFVAAPGTTPAPTSRLKYWNGSAWVAKTIKYYNGSTFVEKPLKYWNGSSWIS